MEMGARAIPRDIRSRPPLTADEAMHGACRPFHPRRSHNKTRRTCEFYPTPATTANKNKSAPIGLSLYRVTWDIAGDDAERRSLCYMRERAIYDISGYFESDFWDRLVLQISYTEPVVRHALLGLSSLCETYESQGSKDDQDKRVQFALQHYNKAVGLLADSLAASSQPQLEVMIYDRYDSYFDQILTLAEQLIRNSQQMGRIIFFDMGVMAPLFYVVLKCRNLALRRKALSLLRLAPCREGMWYRQDTIEYAEWKIGTEERGRGQLSEAEALPQKARVYNEHMTGVMTEGRQKTVVSFQWDGPDGVEYGQDITDLSTRMGQLI
ncbi:hypothetical protein F5X68DRAFT_231702 [Plectosphaerella plurivora]|uniref:Uncharacterized protein n=1 Tax=Plectosphaerella plurivora TaxID=936078 RepID=A0A9P8VA53_9PEZI|nr:hypothetical protein F5X68DRAFT_231702 [Plectosphaerella plurivora]